MAGIDFIPDKVFIIAKGYIEDDLVWQGCQHPNCPSWNSVHNKCTKWWASKKRAEAYLKKIKDYSLLHIYEVDFRYVCKPPKGTERRGYL